MTSNKLIGLKFEIFGTVQGVFFRKYTERQAKSYKLVGWVANTHKQSVKGEVQGLADNVLKMKEWLTNSGSPLCQIDDARFESETSLDKLQFSNFGIKKTF